jgi:DNA/RNA endonuclease G (NUC1)
VWPLLYGVLCDRVKSDFYEDPSADPVLRNKLADFKGSGYDRGHMVRGMQYIRLRSMKYVMEAGSATWGCLLHPHALTPLLYNPL